MANWMYKTASPETWLRSQGVPDSVLRYVLNDAKFPPKMQKWLALQLRNKVKHDPNFSPENFNYDLIEIRDWFNHMSHVTRNFDVMRYSLEQAKTAVAQWQEDMQEERGSGNARLYTQPNYNAEDLGDGFQMVEVVPDDLGNEGAIMQHCVGDDDQDYRKNILLGKTKIFSLRDSHGWPHATIEVENDLETEEDLPKRDTPYEYREEFSNLSKNMNWAIIQIQGKQNNSPVNKYRPYLRRWLKLHENEIEVSEDDILSVTSDKELLSMIFNNVSDEELFSKAQSHLSLESQELLFNKIIANIESWNNLAIQWIIGKLTDIYPYGGNNKISSDLAREYRKNILIKLLNLDYNDKIRAMALNKLGIDLIGRTEKHEIRTWLKNMLSKEKTSPEVADAILYLLSTQKRDHNGFYHEYPKDILSMALASFWIFNNHPASGNLKMHITETALSNDIDNQTASMLIRATVNPDSIYSTYTIRKALNNIESKRFYKIWQMLDDKTRNRLMKDDSIIHNGSKIIYEDMNKHQLLLEEWNKYQREWDRYYNNVKHTSNLQPPDIPIPEWTPKWDSNKNLQKNDENDKLKNNIQNERNSFCVNWLQKLSQNLPPTYIGVGHNYRWNSEIGKYEELWKAKDDGKVIVWYYKNGKIITEPGLGPHWIDNADAKGRIETGNNRGSITFDNKNKWIQRKILRDLIQYYPDIKFGIYEVGGPYSFQQYWEKIS